jgi:anti-anti-sigma factor
MELARCSASQTDLDPAGLSIWKAREYPLEDEPKFSWFASQGPSLPAITGLVIPKGRGAMGLQPPFGARSQENDGVATIALTGELDMATAPILSDSLAPFDGNGVSTIILDLHDLTFIDSSGLLAFLEARRRAMSNGHRVLLSGASPSARRLFELTGTQFLLDEPASQDS